MGVKGGCLAGGMRFSAQSAEGECSAWALLPVKGGVLFPKRTPPLEPPEKGKGGFPLDPAHWQFVARRAAQPAESGAVYMASP